VSYCATLPRLVGPHYALHPICPCLVSDRRNRKATETSNFVKTYSTGINSGFKVKVKGQGHWERKCENRFLRISLSKVGQLEFTSNQDRSADSKPGVRSDPVGISERRLVVEKQNDGLPGVERHSSICVDIFTLAKYL